VQRGVEIRILGVENLLKKKFGTEAEVLNDRIVLLGAEKVLELSEDASVLSRIEFPLFLSLQQLKLKEELQELIIALRICFEVEPEQGLHALEALGELAHGCVMDWVPPVRRVLLGQCLPQTGQEVVSVLLEERLHANVELLVALDGVCIVEHSRNQLSVLDVHVLEPVALLLSVKLVEQRLLQVDPFDVQHLNEALVVALVAQQMVHVAARIVHVALLMHDVCGCAEVGEQVQQDVLEAEVAFEFELKQIGLPCEVDGGAALLVALDHEGQDVVGAEFLEALDDGGQFSCVDLKEDAAHLLKGLEAEADSHIQFFFLTHLYL